MSRDVTGSAPERETPAGTQGGAVDFSIVLVNFNSATYIEACLGGIRRQQFQGSTEIICVSNRSTDGSLEMLERQDDVTLLEPGKNLGYSRANNIGIRASSGEFVLCLNFDCILTEGFLQEVWEAFRANPRVAMISGKMRKLVDMKATMYLDSTGIDFTTLIPADRGEWEYDSGQYDARTSIFGPSGAAACYRRGVLDAVAYKGGQYFDEQMFTYCEDIDLAWRLNLAGWKGLFVPGALAFHERGATRRDSRWKKVGYFGVGFSNRHFTMAKNLRWREDLRGRIGKLARQEWRYMSSWCRRSPARWSVASYSLLRLASLVLRPSFFAKRRLAHRASHEARLDLGMGVDFWQLAYNARAVTPGPIAFGWTAAGQIEANRAEWLISTGGLRDVSWESDSLLCGTSESARCFVELHVPQDYQDKLRKTQLRIEADLGGDATGHIEVFAPDGKSAMSDWFLLKGGRGAYVFELEKVRLSPGADNIRVWQGRWVSIRVHLSRCPDAQVRIDGISFVDESQETTNLELNTLECARLPAVMESYPVLIYAEAATICNLRCSMCGRTVHGVPKSTEGLMKREVFEKLAALFTPGGRLALFGRGETLLHPEFPYFLELAKQRGMNVCFNTNGKALTREIACAMVEHGQDSLTVSCSAGTPGTYSAVHCGGSWRRLWENIDGLRQVKTEYGGDGRTKPVVYLEFVSQMRNIHELPGLVRRAVERGLQGVLVIDLVAHSDQLEKQRMNTPETAPVAEKYYRQALSVCEKLRSLQPDFELRLPSHYDALTKKSIPRTVAESNAALARRFFRRAGDKAGRNFCLEPWQTFYARFDGTVAPCVITNRILGDLNTRDGREIWNGAVFRKFRERMRSDEKPFECLRCHLFPGPRRYDKALDNVEEYAPL